VVEGILGSTEQRPALAIVGGTREFRNARGQLFGLPGPTPDTTKLVFALLFLAPPTSASGAGWMTLRHLRRRPDAR
jgi:hypothetical protein